MIQQDSQAGEQSQSKLGPGDRLQTARISNGMTVEEVARKMHLSTSILISLEENHFEDITAPIFVKGYLRAYSRLVNLNEDDIIQQYTTYYTNGDPPISTTSNALPEINADDRRVKRITYLVLLGLIVLLSTWWWNRFQQAPETVSLESGNKPQSEVLDFDVSTKVAESTSQPIESTEVDAEKESLQLEIKTVVDSLQLEQQQAEERVANTTKSEDTVDVPSVETVEDTVIDEVITETALVEDVVDNEVAVEESVPLMEPRQPQHENNLVITVNADTWASIKDADGNKLVYDLLRSGETVSVSGKAPFKAFLGNGYGVTLKYQGKNIDLSSSIRPNNTARITIGQ